MTGPLPGRDPVKPVAARAKTHLSRYGASRALGHVPGPARRPRAPAPGATTPRGRSANPARPRAGPRHRMGIRRGLRSARGRARPVCRRAARASVPDWDHVWDVARSPARCG